jgi:DNA-binding protein YbaB
MWDKLKQIAQMQGIKKEIEKEIVVTEDQGVRVKINGALEILEIFIDDNVKMDNKKISYVIKTLLNKAIKEVNQITAKKMMEMIN